MKTKRKAGLKLAAGQEIIGEKKLKPSWCS
jgi:hypothetical protein